MDTGADPVFVALDIPQPKVVETYYGCCAKIDQHNRCRQQSLSTEKKLGTHNWDKRSNFGIFGMCVVNVWFCYKNSAEKKETQEDFYTFLAEETIDNMYGIIFRRSRNGSTRAVAVVGGIPLISDGMLLVFTVHQ